ncbi:NAD(P)-dependent alcohol dehydrogenase [Agrobacterium vitis]|uniref:NAD(P)-dependent alcohol dehydrogenase n=1 Tax=Agrobacterium vitis TaxID=373 RepID=UPI0012E77ADD|nr:NAD(P)-dependent alcohol dehydrogenase [Agrobacterium vitis]MUZ65644.1 alcohol dehydrogenase catalytic domain-containing protein [Agrobacterium vitis]
MTSTLVAGAGLAAAPLFGVQSVLAQSAANGSSDLRGARAYAATSATSGMVPINIERRDIRRDDVLIDILYCGVCRSDIHMARGEWAGVVFPVVPGHEIIGRVSAVGSAVTRFKVGDVAGVATIVDTCGVCENCKRGIEQYCLNRVVFTYNSPETGTGKNTFGGYSDKIVVTERFVISIPDRADLPATAPLLCAGATTYSPMQHWNLKSGQRVAIVGLGGLGHVAVKLAAARNAEVTVFTTSPDKIADARRFGAKDAYLWTDTTAFERMGNSLDLIISTVPNAYPMQQFVNLLKLDGTLVNVGALEQLEAGLDGRFMARRRKSISGSLVASVAETQEMIDYCVARNIKSDIEIIPIQDINRAYDRIVAKDVRYRFVVDMASLR